MFFVIYLGWVGLMGMVMLSIWTDLIHVLAQNTIRFDISFAASYTDEALGQIVVCIDL